MARCSFIKLVKCSTCSYSGIYRTTISSKIAKNLQFIYHMLKIRHIMTPNLMVNQTLMIKYFYLFVFMNLQLLFYKVCLVKNQ